MHETCYRSVRFGLVRNRLRLCLRLQVNNVNTVESLACSSVWQHFRQAQETRQQRLEWRDLSPCVSVCVCLCGKVDHLKVAHCFGFFFLFWDAGSASAHWVQKERQKVNFQLHLMRAREIYVNLFRSKPALALFLYVS